MRFFLLLVLIFSARVVSVAAVFEVGPQKKFAAIGEVPWENLLPGDTVLIHWRRTAYHEKFVICRQGSANAPITIRGVPGPAGELPVIDGRNATTRPELDFWGDVRGVVKIGGARKPADTMPRYIILENLEICGGRPPASFRASNGEEKKYYKNAAAIYVEKAEHLTIRNCILRESGNGLFIGSNNERASAEILVEGNYIYDNGNPKSGQEHNVYTAAIGITFQFNRFGLLSRGALGNGLKDRSAGTVIRYNWIEGGTNPLDLVEGEDSVLIREHPDYKQTFVYGNILFKESTAWRPFFVHFGGDGADSRKYRKGTLYFYNNTVVSERKNGSLLFRVADNGEKIESFNNIIYAGAADAKNCGIYDGKGSVQLHHDWISTEWKPRWNMKLESNVTEEGVRRGVTPGFLDPNHQNFRLRPDSPCRDAGVNLPGFISTEHPVTREYVKNQQSRIQPKTGAPDIGGYEFSPEDQSNPRASKSSSSSPR